MKRLLVTTSLALGILVRPVAGVELSGGAAVQVLTNQIGYESAGPKHVVVRAGAGDTVSSCVVRNAATGAEALRAPVTQVGAVAGWKDWRFWTVELDALTAEGRYAVECATSRGSVRSYPFLVQKNVLERETLSNVLFYFKGQRASGAWDKSDRALRFEGKEDATLDLHGGWYDATGDYGKHLSHLSFSTYFNPQQIPLTVWALVSSLRQLESRQEPAFRQYRRRLLDEALHGADFLVRMHDPKGSFYRSVSAPGPEKRPEDRRVAAERRRFAIKNVQTDSSAITAGGAAQDVEAYEVGYRAGGGLAIAALAAASVAPADGEHTRQHYLQAATDAFAFLEARNLQFTNDGKENVVDDYAALLAASELYAATHEARYKEAADRRAQNLIARLTSSGAYKDYWRADETDRPFFHASDAGLPVISLLRYVDSAEGERRRAALAAIKRSLGFELGVTAEVANPFGYARQLVQSPAGGRRTSFFFPHDTEASPWWQGENARLASLATAARLALPHFEDDAAFQQRLRSYARSQLDWILGLNPFDASMLHGTGRNNPAYMFFDSYEYTNAPGGICNGITSGFRDERDIDLNVPYAETGADHDWRWGEQWLPHASWFLLAVSAGDAGQGVAGRGAK
jgi:hypothetical protein